MGLPRRPDPWLAFGGFLLTIALTQPGCVRVQRVADVRARLDSVVLKIDQAVQKTTDDVQQMRRLCEPLLAARPRLGPILARIEGHLAALRDQRDAVVRLRVRLDRLGRGRAEIRADSPEWGELQQLRADYAAVGKRVEQIVEQYGKDATELLAAVQA